MDENRMANKVQWEGGLASVSFQRRLSETTFLKKKKKTDESALT